MRSKRNVFIVGTLVALLFVFAAVARAADPAGQVLVNYADILKANPMPAGEKAQAIKVADDGTATVMVGRFAPGAEVKAHYHKSHSETVYVIEGNGEMTLEGKVVEIKAGTVHFNPMGKVHAVKNTGSVDLVAVQVFTPAMSQPDRVMAP